MENLLTDAAALGELGKRISRHRLNRNITQQTLADSAGVSLSTVQRFEEGNSIQLSLFIRILRSLDMLENLDLLVPEPGVSPIQQLKLQGKRRKRASSPRSADTAEPWTWRDEQ